MQGLVDSGGTAEARSGRVNLHEGGVHGLLRAAERIVDELHRGGAQGAALGGGGALKLLRLSSGDTDYLLLVDHGAGLFLGCAAYALGLALGVSDELVARRDETLGLAELRRDAGLYLLYHAEHLVALNYALVVAQRDAPRLADHGIQAVYELHDFVVHCFISPSWRAQAPRL